MAKEFEEFGKYVLNACCEYSEKLYLGKAFIKELISIPVLVKAKRLGQDLSPLLYHSPKFP